MMTELKFAEKPSTRRFRDIEGQKFGRLLIVGYCGQAGNNRKWFALCDCGTLKIVLANSIIRGLTRSCGCLSLESSQTVNRRHGMSETKVYRCWKAMRSRCSNPNVERYAEYGGRGISVCKRWLVFENFLDDMGQPPSIEYSIDRIDRNGNYCPENCRWATIQEQNNNQRKNVFITLNGTSQTLAQWCRSLGLKYKTVHNRIHTKGWPADRALELNSI